jgi:hypothetical protein
MYVQRTKEQQFSFKNQQIANTPYHLVKEYPEQAIIKQSDYDNIYQKPLDCAQANYSIHMQKARGDFIQNIGILPPNEGRFAKDDNFDRSEFLTNIKRVKVFDFKGYSKRNCDEMIRKAGDVTQSDALKNGARSH